MMKKNRIRFILDENLGKLAKWLRFLGYDAAIYKSISIDNKIRLANKERRVYLTRDKKIAKLKREFSRKLIVSQDYKKQLRELKDYIEFAEEYVFSQCPNCNIALKSIDKDKIKKLVPKFIYQTNNDFKVCYKCGRVFWKGSHYKEIISLLREILEG